MFGLVRYLKGSTFFYEPKGGKAVGKVFMWDPIINDKVPRVSSFEVLDGEVRFALCNSPAIGAVVCGSTNYKTHNRRSDIDCFVYYPEEQRSEMVRCLQELVSMAEELFVPLEFIHLSTGMEESGHSISASLLNHIWCASQNGGVVKSNPFETMRVRALDARLEAVSWLQHKIRMVDEGCYRKYSEERETAYLQRLLEAPISGTRKALLVHQTLEDDSKKAVLEMAEQSFPDLADELERLVEVDDFYTESLDLHLRLPSESDYRELLRTIRAEGEAVRRYMKELLGKIG